MPYEGYVLRQTKNGWEVAYSDRGKISPVSSFSETEAQNRKRVAFSSKRLT
jgi:hypothetical protein